jgi:hypothetical protein
MEGRTRKGIIDFVMVEALSPPLPWLTRRENPYRINRETSTKFRTKWKVSMQHFVAFVIYKFSKCTVLKYEGTY